MPQRDPMKCFVMDSYLMILLLYQNLICPFGKNSNFNYSLSNKTSETDFFFKSCARISKLPSIRGTMILRASEHYIINNALFLTLHIKYMPEKRG